MSTYMHVAPPHSGEKWGLNMHMHETGTCVEKAQVCITETPSSYVQSSVQALSIHSLILILILQMRKLRETKALA